jgi:hypothetical protein
VPTIAKQGKDYTMGEQFFDDLARGLDEGTISRGRALKLAGGALLGAVVPSLFPREAEAISRARRRCRRKGGVYLSHGDCHCTLHCNSDTSKNFSCNDNQSCPCLEAVEGRGFCSAGGQGTNFGCTSSGQCSEPGRVCVVVRSCPGSGASCTSDAQCKAIASSLACINGTCQQTSCFLPCE